MNLVRFQNMRLLYKSQLYFHVLAKKKNPKKKLRK